MAYYMVHVNSGNAAFVKDYQFFKEQGGFKQSWGRGWRRVRAKSLEDARSKAHRRCGSYGSLVNKYT